MKSLRVVVQSREVSLFWQERFRCMAGNVFGQRHGCVRTSGAH